MNVYDFCEMYEDPSILTIEIWDINEARVVYSGRFYNIPMELEDEQVSSFSTPDRIDWIILNIDFH